MTRRSRGQLLMPRLGGSRSGPIVMPEIASESGAVSYRWRGVALVAGAAAV